MWNAPGEGKGRGGWGEKELRKLSIISDYKENVGQDRTSHQKKKKKKKIGQANSRQRPERSPTLWRRDGLGGSGLGR